MRTLLLIGALIATPVMADESTDPSTALLEVCPGIGRFSRDLQVGVPVKRDADLTTQREKGWKQVYSVRVQVSAQPRSILRAGINAQGDVCTFDMDAKTMREVAVSKKACMSICAGELLQNTGKPYVAYFGKNGARQFMN